MASQESQEGLYVVVMFLGDGSISMYDRIEPKQPARESGDLMHLLHPCSEEEEACIILGVGDNEHDAVQDSKTYYHRISKWHGQEKVLLYGHDLSQTQFFQDTSSEAESTDSDATWFEAAEENRST